MPDSARQPSSIGLFASGVVFVGYLAFQVIYPALSWFLPGYDKFTWHMYAGLDLDPKYTVRFADGSLRAVGSPLKVGSPVRVLGPSVDQRRFLPPWLCAHWNGAEAVIARDTVTNHEEVLPCPPVAR